jgi:hypothetical protein
MENKDKPAFGFVDNRSNSNEYCNGVPFNEGIYYGLTKREYFAGLAMQSFITTYISEEDTISIIDKCKVDIARMAIAYADELLKQLESSNQ